MKKRLTQDQEFSVMKMVMDKLLWIATIIAGFGFYKLYLGAFAEGLWIVLAGAVVFILFMVMIMREYQFLR